MIGIKVFWFVNLCCYKIFGVEGFIVRRLGIDVVCVCGFVKMWGIFFIFG